MSLEEAKADLQANHDDAQEDMAENREEVANMDDAAKRAEGNRLLGDG